MEIFLFVCLLSGDQFKVVASMTLSFIRFSLFISQLPNYTYAYIYIHVYVCAQHPFHLE